MTQEDEQKTSPIKNGDKIQINSNIFKVVFRNSDSDGMIGIVSEIFWVDDDHVQIDIKNNHQRFRWDSKRDGGTFKVLLTK